MRLDSWCRHHAQDAGSSEIVALLPFAHEALASLDATAEVTRLAQAEHLENSKVNLLRLGRLLRVVDCFADAGVRAVVLKGAALAFRYYQNYGVRAMGDVDLLVRRADLERAVSLLTDLGWSGTGDSSAAFLARMARVQHGTPFSAAPAHSLDLHWRSMYVVTPEIEDRFWDAVESFAVGSTRVEVLGPGDQIFHVCCHAVQPNWKPSPRWMLDVHAIVEAHGTRIDWDRLVETARRSHTTLRVHAALVALAGVMRERIPARVTAALAAAGGARWERQELSLFEKMPPFALRDRLRWHWYRFRRLRESDDAWQGQPMLTGFLDYARLKLAIRRTQGSRGV